MMNFSDFPYAQVKTALGTVIGRLILLVVVAFMGGLVGVLMVTREFSIIDVTPVSFIGLSMFSLGFGRGLIAFPLVFLFAILFIFREWPLKTVAIVGMLMAWNFYATMTWNEEQAARMRQQMPELNALPPTGSTR